MTANRPNLLFVFGDQHRWCDLGCYGNNTVASPNFDALAESGLRFNTCVSNTPLCVPARAALLTGQLGLKHRAITNDLPINTDLQSIADVFSSAGYRTGYIGKWHLSGIPRDVPVPPGRTRLGFDEWKVYNCSHAYLQAAYFDENDNRHELPGYEPEGQTDLAIDFVKRNHEEPWALYLSWGPPHDPYHAVPDGYLDQYDEADIQLRPNVPEEITATVSQTLSRDEVRRNVAGYYAQVTALDDQMGRLLDALERTGQRENTIVVYTSDHGDMLGSQGWTNKQLPYEESIRVPLLVSWPGVVRTGTTDELIGLVDLPVSLLGLAGLSYDEPTDGTDLHQLFLDENAPGLSACYITDLVPCHQAAMRASSEWRGIRTRQHTFARTSRDDGYLLYDNHHDPYQLTNLINDPAHTGVRDELRALLNDYISRHDELLPPDELIRKYDFADAWNASERYAEAGGKAAGVDTWWVRYVTA